MLTWHTASNLKHFSHDCSTPNIHIHYYFWLGKTNIGRINSRRYSNSTREKSLEKYIIFNFAYLYNMGAQLKGNISYFLTPWHLSNGGPWPLVGTSSSHQFPRWFIYLWSLYGLGAWIDQPCLLILSLKSLATPIQVCPSFQRWNCTFPLSISLSSREYKRSSLCPSGSPLSATRQTSQGKQCAIHIGLCS